MGNRFEERYRDATLEDIPWYHAEPDADLVALLDETLDPAARVLDLGAGPAVHSIHLASRGHRVVAIDYVAAARDMALGLAERAGVELDYRVGDALDFVAEQPFDAVFDRGYMHTLEPEQRASWRQTVCAALRPGGALIVKCFNVLPLRDFGPPGLSAADVVALLGDPGAGGLELRSLTRGYFGPHRDEHATWTVLARRI